MPATTSQILDAFQLLSAQELRALHLYAESNLSAPYSEPLDLIHEALHRSLDGRRNWPIHVQFVVFMMQTIKSIVGHDRERIENQAARNVAIDSDWPERSTEGATSSVEEQVIAFEQVERARKAAARARDQLRGDEVAQKVLDGVIAGLSPREACDHYGIDRKTYDSARHRVARRLREGALH